MSCECSRWPFKSIGPLTNITSWLDQSKLPESRHPPMIPVLFAVVTFELLTNCEVKSFLGFLFLVVNLPTVAVDLKHHIHRKYSSHHTPPYILSKWTSRYDITLVLGTKADSYLVHQLWTSFIGQTQCSNVLLTRPYSIACVI